MIKSIEQIDQARTAFCRLFSSTNPFEPVGRTEYPVRVVIFPSDSYHLEREQFDALIHAARSNQETSFFISEMESSEPFDPNARWKRKHWECTDPTFEEYTSLPLGIENALYSESGLWGVLLSHELHGLLVCSEQFLKAFKTCYSNYADDFQEFIDYWQRIRDESQTETKWLDPFVAHLTQHK